MKYRNIHLNGLKNHNHHYMCYDIKKEIILFDFKSVLWMLKVDFEKHEFLKYYKI